MRDSRPAERSRRPDRWPRCREALERTGLNGRTVAIDEITVPSAIARAVPVGRPAGADLATIGAIKTPTEVDAIHAAAALSDIGHRAAREAGQAGATELEIWSHVSRCLNDYAGGAVVALGDVLSGPRTTLIGGPPTTRAARSGDSVLVDIALQLGGMWSDSCASWAVGEPQAAHRRAHAAVTAALEIGLEVLGPNVTAGHVDAVVREAVARRRLQLSARHRARCGFHRP